MGVAINLVGGGDQFLFLGTLCVCGHPSSILSRVLNVPVTLSSIPPDAVLHDPDIPVGL